MTYIDHKDGTLTIENLDKEDNDGYMFGHEFPVLQTITEENGVADKVTIAGTTFSVRNKQPLGTYKQPL
jgi:hypothetical protein